MAPPPGATGVFCQDDRNGQLSNREAHAGIATGFGKVGAGAAHGPACAVEVDKAPGRETSESGEQDKVAAMVSSFDPAVDGFRNTSRRFARLGLKSPEKPVIVPPPSIPA